MSVVLRSDNFGNRMKLIENIDELSDGYLLSYQNNIINIFGGMRSFLKKYLLYIPTNMDILTQLNTIINPIKKNSNVNINENDDSNTSSDELSLLNLTRDILCKSLNYLQLKDVLSFELVSKHCCFLGRIPISIMYINKSWKHLPELKDYYRFSRIKYLHFSEPNGIDFYKNDVKFIRAVCKSVEHLSFTDWNTELISLLEFKKLQSLVILNNNCVIDITPDMIGLFSQLKVVKLKDISYVKDGSQLLNDKFKELHHISSINSFKIKRELNNSFPWFQYNIIKYHSLSLNHLKLNLIDMEMIIEYLKRNNTIIHLDNLKEFILFESTSKESKPTNITSADINKYFVTRNVNRFHISVNRVRDYIKYLDRITNYENITLLSIFVFINDYDNVLNQLNIIKQTRSHIMNQKFELLLKFELTLHDNPVTFLDKINNFGEIKNNLYKDMMNTTVVIKLRLNQINNANIQMINGWNTKLQIINRYNAKLVLSDHVKPLTDNISESKYIGKFVKFTLRPRWQ